MIHDEQPKSFFADLCWTTGAHSYEDIGTQVRATQNEENGYFYKRDRGIKQRKRDVSYSAR